MRQIPNKYAITKPNMDNWYLYTAERVSYGICMKWTTNIDQALLFSTEHNLEMFVDKVLDNKPVNVFPLHLPNDLISY